MNKIKILFYEIRLELSRVSWPKGRELWNSTWIVIYFSIILAIFIGLVDLLFSHGIRLLLK
ncbi:MAG: preprotein translocase subunit SecE [Candidatus Stahlbacteria bacterium]|nr:preprotein translocase subunit SecE [Candidatus Stahlbacteria bacterium]